MLCCVTVTTVFVQSRFTETLEGGIVDDNVSARRLRMVVEGIKVSRCEGGLVCRCEEGVKEV